MCFAVGMATLGCATIFVFFGFQFYQRYLEAAVLRLARPHGVVTDLDGKVRIYDHGPYMLGGWQAFAWTDNQLTLQKVFRIPERYVDQTFRIRNIRFPLLASEASDIKVELNLSPGIPLEKVVRISPGRDPLTWVNLEIPEQKRRVLDRELVGVRVRLLDDLPNSLRTILDTHRYYARSAILTSEGSGTTVPGEFAVEIDLENE